MNVSVSANVNDSDRDQHAAAPKLGNHMIDSHRHLTDPNLLDQIQDVLARAATNNVTRMITIGTHPQDARRATELCHRVPNVRCAVGIHPNYSHEVDPADWPELREIQNDPCVLALGEMGLDYFHHFAPPERQHKTFE